MKKYLVAALVACLGILSVNAQVDKTIEVSQCEANNKLTVEGQTLIPPVMETWYFLKMITLITPE